MEKNGKLPSKKKKSIPLNGYKIRENHGSQKYTDKYTRAYRLLKDMYDYNYEEEWEQWKYHLH